MATTGKKTEQAVQKNAYLHGNVAHGGMEDHLRNLELRHRSATDQESTPRGVQDDEQKITI